jgi:hypothetical protein
MSTMVSKMMIGLAMLAIASAATTMSAFAEQRKLRVTMPKEVCETLTVSTQNWGQQTVRVCGPPGGARGQATMTKTKIKHHQTWGKK